MTSFMLVVAVWICLVILFHACDIYVSLLFIPFCNFSEFSLFSLIFSIGNKENTNPDFNSLCGYF